MKLFRRKEPNVLKPLLIRHIKTDLKPYEPPHNPPPQVKPPPASCQPLEKESVSHLCAFNLSHMSTVERNTSADYILCLKNCDVNPLRCKREKKNNNIEIYIKAQKKKDSYFWQCLIKLLWPGVKISIGTYDLGVAGNLESPLLQSSIPPSCDWFLLFIRFFHLFRGLLLTPLPSVLFLCSAE